VTLTELIAALEAADPNQVVPRGFTHPHSYRGYYNELAFEPAANVTVHEMLTDARSALGSTYQGYKGGDFTMPGHTDCWLSMEGSASGDSLSALLLELMLAEARAVSAVPAPATDQAADVAEAIRAFPFDDFGMDDVSYALEAAPDSQEWVPKLADAVLAVLPASLDRAAVLREAADAVRDGDLGPRGGMSSDYENGWWNSRAAAEDRIRRMADKPRQEEAGRGNPQETPLTADQQVRGVQAWMALDLHQALGWPVDHSATVEHQGRKSWGDWWAELLAGVRNVQMIRRYRGELLEPTAALREAADHVETLTGQAYEHALSDHEIGRANGLETAMRELRRMADETPQQQSRQWCKCRSCWGWFVEDHPGEDLDELGRDLSWWSGLPEHRDAPAVVAQPDEEA
jgi:hypothetical protein